MSALTLSESAITEVCVRLRFNTIVFETPVLCLLQRSCRHFMLTRRLHWRCDHSNRRWTPTVTTCAFMPRLPAFGGHIVDTSQCKTLFTKYDKDKSGAIDKSEVPPLLRELNLRLSPALYEKYCDKFFREADLDSR